MNNDDCQAESASISRRSLGRMIAAGSALGLLAIQQSAKAQGSAENSITGGSAQDRLQIQQLLYRYARSLDDRDPQVLIDCWIPGKWTAEGAEKVIKFHQKYAYTVHNVLNYSYAIRDRSAAGMHYSMVTYVKDTAGKLTLFNAYARYPDDELVKRDGRWLFTKRQWVPIFSTAEIPVVKEVPEGFWEGLK